MLTSLARRLIGSVILICGVVILGALLASGAGAPLIASASPLADSPTPPGLPAYVDMFATQNNQGLFGPPDSLELFGPGSCAANGDPFTPLLYNNTTVANPYYNMINPPAVHTYRVAIPPEYPYNLVRIELFDPQTANLNPSGADGSMSLPASGSLYLPTSVVNLNNGNVPITTNNRCVNSGGITDVRTSQREPCVFGRDAGTTGAIDSNNPFWYVRLDENRASCGTGNNYDPALNTTTRFSLYYYKQEAGGQLTRTNLAQYTGKSDGVNATEAYQTALKWVSPVATSGSYITPATEQMPAFSPTDVGGPLASSTQVSSPAEPRVATDACPAPCSATSNDDFIINLGGSDVNGQPGGETNGIYTDPVTGARYIYLDVQGTSGSSENNFSLWAGPALSEDVSVRAPSFVNARQVYLLRNKLANPSVTLHESKGLAIYGQGHLPLNALSPARYRFPLVYISGIYAGMTMSVRFFDADAGTQPPIAFYFDNIPQSTWSACWGTSATCANEGSTKSWQYMGIPPAEFGTNCATLSWSCGKWVTFNFTLPSPADPMHPVAFNGGRMMVDYQGGSQDTFDIMLTLAPPPAPALSAPTAGAQVQGTPVYRWSAPLSATGYQFEYDDNPDFSSPVYTSGLIIGTSFTPPTQAVGTYSWHVRAKNDGGGWGPWSSLRSVTIVPGAPPTAPDNLSATGASATRIDLSWASTSPFVDTFHIERSEDGAAWSEIGTTGPGVTTYADSGLQCGETRYYRVYASNAFGSSDPTVPATATTVICPPAAPSGLSATVVSATQIDLSWTDNSDSEASFRIERSPAGANTWTPVGTVDADTTSYSDMSPVCGDLEYRVIATNAGGDSAPSSSDSVMAIICPPAPPANLSATTFSRWQIDLSWDSSPTATGYSIERSPAGDENWESIYSVGAGVTSYSDDYDLACGHAYKYRVYAFNAGGDSLPSASASATTTICPPDAPSGLSATAVSQTEIDLAWTDNSTNEASFKIERSPAGENNWAVIGTADADATSYADADSGLTCETAYDYRVTAVNAGGVSDPSTLATATTVICDPSSPSSLSVVGSSATEIDLSWVDNSDNETGFKIERSPAGENKWSVVDTTANTETRYTDQGLACGSFKYRVRAINAGGDSAPSNEAGASTRVCLDGKSGRPKIATPAKTLLTGDPEVTFGWPAVANADTYRLQVSTSSRFKTLVLDKADLMTPTYSASLGDGTFYVRVQAVNSQGVAGKWSGARKVMVDITPPPAPQLKSAVVKRNLPALTVLRSTGAVRYEFEVSSGGGVLFSALVKSPSFKAKAGQALLPGSYHWRVRAYDRVGNVSEWSDPGNFDVP